MVRKRSDAEFIFTQLKTYLRPPTRPASMSVEGPWVVYLQNIIIPK